MLAYCKSKSNLSPPLARSQGLSTFRAFRVSLIRLMSEFHIRWSKMNPVTFAKIKSHLFLLLRLTLLVPSHVFSREEPLLRSASRTLHFRCTVVCQEQCASMIVRIIVTKPLFAGRSLGINHTYGKSPRSFPFKGWHRYMFLNELPDKLHGLYEIVLLGYSYQPCGHIKLINKIN